METKTKFDGVYDFYLLCLRYEATISQIKNEIVLRVGSTVFDLESKYHGVFFVDSERGKLVYDLDKSYWKKR